MASASLAGFGLQQLQQQQRQLQLQQQQQPLQQPQLQQQHQQQQQELHVQGCERWCHSEDGSPRQAEPENAQQEQPRHLQLRQRKLGSSSSPGSPCGVAVVAVAASWLLSGEASTPPTSAAELVLLKPTLGGRRAFASEGAGSVGVPLAAPPPQSHVCFCAGALLPSPKQPPSRRGVRTGTAFAFPFPERGPSSSRSSPLPSTSSSRRPPPPSLEEVSKCRSPAEVFGLLFPSQPGVGGSEEGSFSAEEAEAPPLRSWSLLLAVSCFRRLAQLRSSSSDSSRSGAKQQRQPVTPEKESFQFQSLLRRLEGLAASSEMSARTLSEVMAAAGHLGSSSKSSSNSSNNSSSNSYINSNSDSNSNSNNNSSSNSNSNSNSHSNNNSQPGIEALVRRCAASLTQGIHRANAF
ncbi:unnamed protein product, partial [Polarella glacialis]